MGERFGAASRPGPHQWVTLARALELCRTQPSACPWAPSSPSSLRPEDLEGPGRRLWSSSHCTLCSEDHCQADCWQSRTSNHWQALYYPIDLLYCFHFFHFFYIGFLSAVLIGWFTLFCLSEHICSASFSLLFIAFSSAFIWATEFSNFSWLLYIVSSSFLQ